MDSLLCRGCGDDFDPQAQFLDSSGRKPVFRRHADVGFRDQCGECWLAGDESWDDRVIALEEPPPGGGKASCEVMPISRAALGSSSSGMGRHVLYTQHHQPLGVRR